LLVLIETNAYLSLKVANVRFNVCKCMEKVGLRLDGTSLSTDVKPMLQRLSRDQDIDVQYFAQRALQTLA